MSQIRTDQAQLIITVDARESAEYQKTLAAAAKGVADIKKLTVGQEDYNKALQEQADISRRLQSSTDYNRLSIKQLSDRRAQLVQLQRTLPQVTFAEAGLEAELRQVNTAMAESARRTRAVSQEMDSSGQGMNRFGDIIKGLFATVIGFNFLAILKQGFSALIGSSVDFEAAMSKVKAVSNATDADVKRLSDRAKELGETTSKTAVEAAEGLEYLALAGYTTEQQLIALEPVLRLSEAGGIALGRASDLATDSLSAMGLGASDLTGFLDKITNTSTISNSSIEQLNEAFIRSGGLLRTLEVPLSEANALFGVLANRGEKGSEAGTGLNAVLINLSTGAGQAGEAMEKLNLSAFDSNGQFKGVGNVLKELNEKMVGMTQEQQNYYKAMIGGKVNIGTLSALLDGVGKEFDSLSEKIDNSEGALNRVANTMLDNTKGSWTLLKSTVEGAAIAIGEKLLPYINATIKGGIVFINTLRAIPEFIRENEVALKALALGLIIFNSQMVFAAANSLRLAAVEKGRAIVTGAVTTAQWLLNAAMTANPIGLVVKAVGLLVAGFGILYSKSETVRAGISGLGNVATEIFTIIKEAVGSFIDGWNQLKEGNFSDALSSFGDAITKANPVSIAFTQGKRLKDAFNKGYNDKLEAERAKKEAEKQAKDLVDGVDKIGGRTYTIGDEKDLGGSSDSKKKKKEKTEKDKKGILDIEFYDPAKAQVALDMRLKQLEDAEKRAQDVLRESFLQGQITEDEYNLERIRSNAANLETRINLLDAYGQKETDKRRELNIKLLEAEKELLGERAQQIADIEAEGLTYVEQRFRDRLITEEEREISLLKVAMNANEMKLQMLRDQGLTETEVYKTIMDEQLALQYDYDTKKLESTKRTEAMRQAVAEQGFQAASDLLSLGAELLGQDEKARKKHASAIKAFEVAKIAINLQKEISAIWSNANANPTNILIPGWANIWAGIQTGLAVGRSVLSVGKIKAQQFKYGGSLLGGGTFQGPSHDNGGVPFRVGGQIHEAEGGEVIINKRSSAIFKDALNAINTYGGYGRPIYMTGGTVPSTQPIGLGGVAISSPPVQSDPRVEMLARSVSELTQAIPMALSNISATINYNHLTSEVAKIDDIKRQAGY